MNLIHVEQVFPPQPQAIDVELLSAAIIFRGLRARRGNSLLTDADVAERTIAAMLELQAALLDARDPNKSSESDGET